MCECSLLATKNCPSDEAAQPVYLPSKLQLLFLDLIIIFLQLVLITIAYETSVYYAASDAGVVDMLLPDDVPPFSIPLFQPSMSSRPPSGSLPVSPKIPTDSKMMLVAHGHDLPLILDFRFNSILNHIRHPRAPPPPPPRTDTVIPFPNQGPWPLPSIGMLMRTGRQMRSPPGGRAPPLFRDTTRQSRFPGGMDAAPG
ncbi:hypothetical protein CVT25_005858 [Psilocybe cyanescens]|uniref:Uncharacterized protein n=1 Tax=Psilocybe cyanescens TaxID=93625 RepID=A0A409VM11_PSICY|nr:hypothetical protein CVT25_005858 [Psilocybe cyanescens]